MRQGNLRQQEQNLLAVAHRLRREATPAEAILWQRLRAAQFGGLRFRRQQPLGPFVVDFFCARARLVIELDGDSHEGEAKARRDAQRQAWLEQQGFRVLRFFNAEVYRHPEDVLETIAQHCCELRRPLP